jgi:hypothetical protein
MNGTAASVGARGQKRWSGEHFSVDVEVLGSIFGGDECHYDAQDTLVLEKGFG